MINDPVIIVPAFTRSEALLRLLNSINNAVFPDRRIQLIISLDGGATHDVKKVAKTFQFKHGKATVIQQEENLGLRKHILWCGDQTKNYGSVVILEDDLLVDKYFYKYVLRALKFYENHDRVAGISLYSQRFNVIAKLGFEPLYNGYTAYFIQLPTSWGQAWTYRQWSRFRKWYRSADEQQLSNNKYLPQAIKNWPETSWMKYYAAYMVETDTYFAYPYCSYTTNCADPGGVHMQAGTFMYQVPIGADDRPDDTFSFCSPDQSAAIYDVYLEPLAAEIFRNIDLQPKDIEIDIFGTKPMSLLQKKKYVLTSKKCNNPIQIYRYSFKPVEKIVKYPVSKPKPGLLGYTDYIYVAESKDIKSVKRPFFHQVNYTSYFQIENVYVFRRYILYRITSFLNKIRAIAQKK